MSGCDWQKKKFSVAVGGSANFDKIFRRKNMAKNEIYIKNSSKTINCGLHDIKVVIRTDGGRIQTDKYYLGKFEVDYGNKKKYNTEITLTITAAKESL